MSRIHLQRLEIRELFGRSFDLKLEDLGVGVTVVYGPNASGKSSLASAAGRVFCTRLTQNNELIRATVSHADHILPVELRSPRSDNPVPQSSRPGLYTLSIPDLISGPSAEDTQLISDSLAGGLDLSKCLVSKGSRPPDLDASKNEIDQRRFVAAKTAADEASLDHLEADRELADRAARDLRMIDDWISAAVAESDAESIEAQAKLIAEANPGIERQQPNAAVDVQEAFAQLNEAKNAAAIAWAALNAYDGRTAAGPLTADQRAELDRIASESTKRAGVQESVARSIDHLKAEIELVEKSLPELGRAPLPLEPAFEQRLANAVSAIVNSKDALSRAESAALENKQARTRALESLESFGFNADSVVRVSIDRQQVQLGFDLDEAVRLAREAKNKAESARDEAEARLNQVRRDLPRIAEGVASAAVMALMREDPPISDLADRLRRAKVESEARQAICRSLEGRLDELKSASADAERAVRAMVDWIKAVPSSAEPKRPIVPLLTAAAFAVLALILTFAGLPAVGAIVGAAGLLVVAGLVWFAPVSASGQSRQQESESQAPAGWRPARWNISEVAAKLEEAISALKTAQAAQRLLDEAKAAAATLDPTSFEDELTSRLKRLRELTGFDFTYPYEMALLVNRLAKYQDAIEDLNAKESLVLSAGSVLEERESLLQKLILSCGANVKTGAQLKELSAACERYRETDRKAEDKEIDRLAAEHRLESARSEYRDLLSQFGWPSAGDPETSQRLFQDWISQSEGLLKLENNLKEQTQTAQRLLEERQSCSLRVSEMFALYGYPLPTSPIESIPIFFKWFEVSDAAKQADRAVASHADSVATKLLRNGVPGEGDLEWQCGVPLMREPEFHRYRTLCAEAKEKRSEARLLRKDESRAVIDRYLPGQTPGLAELYELKRRVAKSAERAGALSDQISKIRAEINLATHESSLLTAQRNLDSAISKSFDWLAQMAKSAANRAVLAAIDKATREENTIPVIESANRWLERLTDGKYGSLTEENKDVCVQDRDCGNLVQKTGELSTGTRVHLALSIRLAVIEQSETDGNRFPLFLDEVMASSDQDARNAIAGALKEISQERQVIVLTNQPDEVNLLKKVIGEEVPVKLLPKAEPVPIAPPARAPEIGKIDRNPGLPLTVSVRWWRAKLVGKLLESPVESEDVRVDSVIGETRNEHDLRVVGALESIRKVVLAAYKPLEWRDLEGVDLGGQDMRDKVREAYDQNRTKPEAFLVAVKQIKGKRTNMVDRLRNRLDELELLNGSKGPSEDELLDLAIADLPPALQYRASDIVDVFRDYITTPEGSFS